MKHFSLTVLIVLLGTMSAPASATGTDEKPINIKIKSPDRLADTGILLSGDWQLVLEFEVIDAIGLVDQTFINNSRTNMAWILRDEDDCIHMQDWFAPGDPGAPIEGCPGVRNETFVRFTPDMFDRHGVEEVTGLDGIDAFQLALQDDAYNAANAANLNKQYFERTPGGPPLSFIGPSTESPLTPIDGYGYGVNDDFPGLYIWAEIGTGIVTDLDFNPIPDPVTGAFKLRNMAGLVNGISYTQLTKHEKSSLVAVMNVERGVLEPIVQFDFINVSFGTSTDVGFLRRLDGGPVETFLFPDSTPRSQDAAYTEVIKSLEPFEVIVRVAVVEGDALPFVQDLDGNGKFNRRDIEMAGHTLLSDVQRFKLRAIPYETLDTGVGFECPAANVFQERKLDNDVDGLIGCSTGSARSVVRRPR